MSPEECFALDLKATSEAADWLTENWKSAVRGAALTIQLRERFGIQITDAYKVIGEARRRLGK
jgi:hypothetical protein